MGAHHVQGLGVRYIACVAKCGRRLLVTGVAAFGVVSGSVALRRRGV